ncbi:MAG TPA: hypothetical protein VLM80_08070 [Anaerolineales bacterium]|nr:hypothetical protein [Anaerolineales bacterium]
MNPQLTKPITPWLLLFSRTVFFALFQILIAGFLNLFGSATPWEDASAWWTISALLTNLVSIILLSWLFSRENLRYFNFIPASKKKFWKDLGLTILIFVVLMPFAILPNIWLARMLFGSEEIASALMFRPLPQWARMVSLLFPLTIAFAELPTYFGYAMPRIEKQLGNGWIAWVLASFFLALQHITLPLIFDWRFIIWRLGMFIPLAFLLGLSLKLRPRLFPYLMTMHALLDFTTVLMIFML